MQRRTRRRNLPETDEDKTMLHTAVSMGDAELALILLDAGADVNFKDNDGNTPLTLAIDAESPTMVELLLKYNPNFDIDIVRHKFYDTLQRSSSKDCKRIIRAMINCGFTVKESDIITASLVWAAIMDDLEDIALACVNFKKDILKNIRHWYLSFSLHMQPFNENQTKMFAILKRMNKLFTEVNAIEITGNRNFDLFKILLSEHDLDLINVNVTSMGGNFNDDGEADIVAMTTDALLSCYDSENPICDEFGRTGLHYASKVGNVAVIQALLDIHLDINRIDNDSKTALDYAYDRIEELSVASEINDEDFNNQKHIDPEFGCEYSLLDLKIGAVVLLKQLSKMITANLYIELENIRTVKKLLLMMKEDRVIMQYYMSIHSYIQQCEREVATMKNERLTELSYYDFITKNSNQIALYTKRTEVINVMRMDDGILKKYEVYGPTLRHKFYVSDFRRGLLDVAEAMIFEILKWYQIPPVIVREILGNLDNNELYDILSRS